MIDRRRRFAFWLTCLSLGLLVAVVVAPLHFAYSMQEQGEVVGKFVSDAGTTLEVVDTGSTVDKSAPAMALEAVELTGIRIPFYAPRGVLTGTLTVEKLVYEVNHPAKLTKPVLFRYAKDGLTIIMRMSADHGTIVLKSIGDADILDSLKMWGNIKAQTFEDPYAPKPDPKKRKLF